MATTQHNSRIFFSNSIQPGNTIRIPKNNSATRRYVDDDGHVYSPGLRTVLSVTIRWSSTAGRIRWRYVIHWAEGGCSVGLAPTARHYVVQTDWSVAVTDDAISVTLPDRGSYTCTLDTLAAMRHSDDLSTVRAKALADVTLAVDPAEVAGLDDLPTVALMAMAGEIVDGRNALAAEADALTAEAPAGDDDETSTEPDDSRRMITAINDAIDELHAASAEVGALLNDEPDDELAQALDEAISASEDELAEALDDELARSLGLVVDDEDDDDEEPETNVVGNDSDDIVPDAVNARWFRSTSRARETVEGWIVWLARTVQCCVNQPQVWTVDSLPEIWWESGTRLGIYPRRQCRGCGSGGALPPHARIVRDIAEIDTAAAEIEAAEAQRIADGRDVIRRRLNEILDAAVAELATFSVGPKSTAGGAVNVLTDANIDACVGPSMFAGTVSVSTDVKALMVWDHDPGSDPIAGEFIVVERDVAHLHQPLAESAVDVWSYPSTADGPATLVTVDGIVTDLVLSDEKLRHPRLPCRWAVVDRHHLVGCYSDIGDARDEAMRLVTERRDAEPWDAAPEHPTVCLVIYGEPTRAQFAIGEPKIGRPRTAEHGITSAPAPSGPDVIHQRLNEILDVAVAALAESAPGALSNDVDAIDALADHLIDACAGDIGSMSPGIVEVSADVKALRVWDHDPVVAGELIVVDRDVAHLHQPPAETTVDDDGPAAGDGADPGMTLADAIAQLDEARRDRERLEQRIARLEQRVVGVEQTLPFD